MCSVMSVPTFFFVWLLHLFFFLLLLESIDRMFEAIAPNFVFAGIARSNERLRVDGRCRSCNEWKPVFVVGHTNF